ncbi:hypothetical protein [Vibrio splendidus]|uniref:hypothetical protein n=1 Tax=Vibrio splendidus TaxID=29497 RepID=UPI000D37259F|nr:hypothetical protein [Vibrio splendidus]PTO78443.1 hypothetical protein CWN93_19405 [Vibrio splendidus]
MGVIQSTSAAFPKGQRILIDTNVLYWLTYASSRVFPRTLKPRDYQLSEYPSLFEQLINNENKLYYSRYSISELTSIIARVEASLDGKGQEFQRKSWLKNDNGRDIVVKELEAVIEAIESWADVLQCFPALDAKNYLERYSQVYLDGYDIYIEDEITNNKIGYILTDDIDFTSVPNLNVITANRKFSPKLAI